MKNHETKQRKQRIRTTKSSSDTRKASCADAKEPSKDSNVHVTPVCRPIARGIDKEARKNKSCQQSKNTESSTKIVVNMRGAERKKPEASKPETDTPPLNTPKRKEHLNGDRAASNLVLQCKPGQICRKRDKDLPQRAAVATGFNNPKTLEICLRAIDSGVGGKKRKLDIGVRDTDGIQEVRKDSGASRLEQFKKTTSRVQNSKYTTLDRPFLQPNATNLKYNMQPPTLAFSPTVKVNTQRSSTTEGMSPKVFRITAPLYYCSTGSTNIVSKGKRKGKPEDGRPAKRQLCSHVQRSPAKSLLDSPKISVINMEGRKKQYKVCDIEVLDACDGPRVDTEIWLSPSLQIDTSGCDSRGEMKKDYKRVVAICVTKSTFRPQTAVSSYPDAINTRVIYDKDGNIAVLEVTNDLEAGIYRIIPTRVAAPHVCLQDKFAMETLLVRVPSISNLKPHSQYVVLNELYKVPKTRWRESLSATVVRLRMEDFLHTFNFHAFALPLLLWIGEEDLWHWAKEHVHKFHSTRKKKLVSRKKSLKKDNKNVPPKETNNYPQKTKSI